MTEVVVIVTIVDQETPHWYPEGTYHGKKITINELTLEEIDEYNLGYSENNDFKDWG
jgi:hypothetical protein